MIKSPLSTTGNLPGKRFADATAFSSRSFLYVRKVESSHVWCLGGMFACASACLAACCRQQSQRTTRRTPPSSTGFHPVSSQSGQVIQFTINNGQFTKRGVVIAPSYLPSRFVNCNL